MKESPPVPSSKGKAVRLNEYFCSLCSPPSSPRASKSLKRVGKINRTPNPTHALRDETVKPMWNTTHHVIRRGIKQHSHSALRHDDSKPEIRKTFNDLESLLLQYNSNSPAVPMAD